VGNQLQDSSSRETVPPPRRVVVDRGDQGRRYFALQVDATFGGGFEGSDQIVASRILEQIPGRAELDGAPDMGGLVVH